MDQWFNNQQQTVYQKYQNFEGSYFNPQNAITRLPNTKRDLLLQTFEDLFGVTASVEAEDPNNEFSQRFVSIGGDSLSVTSSGTRLFLGILAALMDVRFQTIAIDEPELGLSPVLQRKLADIIIRGYKRDQLFTHKPNIIISTHSHLFLDNLVPSNNWIVQKSGNLITARPCASFTELHDIQFRLLGNELSHLLLPDAVIFVEGVTDKMYLEKALSLKIPNFRIVIESCQGDIAMRLNHWASSLGDMQVSPYRSRTIVVYDNVKQAGIERACQAVGLPKQNMIEWKENGIEYLYPSDVISTIFRKPLSTVSDLIISRDNVSLGDLSYKKVELCKQVCDQTNAATSLPAELEEKFVGPLTRLLTVSV